MLKVCETFSRLAKLYDLAMLNKIKNYLVIIKLIESADFAQYL